MRLFCWLCALVISTSVWAQTAPAAEEPVPEEGVAPKKKTVIVPVPAAPTEPGKAPTGKEKTKSVVVPVPSGESMPPSPSEVPTAPPQSEEREVKPDAPTVAPAVEPTAVPAPPVDEAVAPVPTEPAVPPEAMLDGHRREGAFLSGPGSLAFVLHHSLLGGLGGLATQVAVKRFDFSQSSREAMLAGALIGAGLGFGSSAWWQFNHWIDEPMAYFGIANSVMAGMLFTGLMDLASNDPTVLTWTAVLGCELGAWLTATLGGGEMPLNKGLLIASGGAWGLVYGALLLAIIGTSSSSSNLEKAIDPLLIAPGVGAGALALASLRYNPTSAQVLRADIFGAGVGGVVLLLSALVLGRFDIPTPYVLSLLSSAGAIAAVSVLWEEAAERPPPVAVLEPARRPYRRVWW